MIASLTTTFILVACLALPVSYASMKANKSDPLPVSYLPFSQLISYIIFVVLSYLLMIAGSVDIAVALALHVGFFAIYAYINNKNDYAEMLKSFYSSWTIFAFLAFEYIISLIYSEDDVGIVFVLVFVISSSIFYLLMVKQKNYSDK
jgi:hypothetical protein